MSTVEVKKALYKRNPTAFLKKIQYEKAYYTTSIEECALDFEVPCNDMGEAEFLPQMPAKLLIRWIVEKP